jgi:hypothetical protein
MLRRCYLTVCNGKEAVFLEPSRAYEYAANNHGYVIRMYGQDDTDVVEVVTEKVDHDAQATLEVGC